MKSEIKNIIENEIDKTLSPLIESLSEALKEKPKVETAPVPKATQETEVNPGIDQYLQEEAGSKELGGRKLDYSRNEPVKATGSLGGKDL